MADFTTSSLARHWFFKDDFAALDTLFTEKTAAYLDRIGRFIDFEKFPSKGETIAEKVKPFELTSEQENKILIACVDELRSQYRNLE